MSRFAKKVGQKSMRFQFDVTVNFVEVHIPIDASVMVIWKRGAKRIETKEKVTISPDNPRGNFNETMSMFATLSKDSGKGKYVEKNTTFTVKVITDTKMKSIGMIKLNLAKFAEKSDQTEEFNLKKCPDRNALIGLTIRNTLIQADCKDADTLSQMTDLRSLDSAPDSQYDFAELNLEKDEESTHESRVDPLKLLERDYERQKKGLPPMFGGSSNSALKNLSSEQFSLKNKAATSAMASLHSGPIRPNKLASKDVQETPEKMDECDLTSEEESNIAKSPSSRSKFKPMPDTSELDSESGHTDKHKKVIKSSAISKLKTKSKRREGGDTQTTAFSYKVDDQEEEKSLRKVKFASPGEEDETGSFKSKQIMDEVKELRSKIRTLESEKRALKEESIKIKHECSEEIRKALSVTGSDDKKAELLQLTVSELESKKDKLELTISKKENEIEKLNRKLEDKDIDIGHMKEKRKELEQKIKDAENKVKQISIEMKGFREQVGNYEQENAALKKEITTLNTTFNRMKDENKELSDMVDKLREQLESRRDSFKHASTVGEDEFEEYKTATEALISDYKSQIKELEKKNEEQYSDYEKLAEEKESSDNDFFKKLQEANRKIDLLQQSESVLKSNVTELEKRVDDLLQERLERERSGMDSQSELMGKYKALEVKYNQVSSKLEDREQKLKSLESKITAIEEEKIYFMSHEEQKRDEIRDEYRSELEDLKDKIHELENKNDQLLIEKDMLEQKLNKELSTNVKSDDIMEGNERLFSQIKKLQGQVMEKDNQILRLQSEVEKGGSGQKSKLNRAHTSRKDTNKDRELAELGVENDFLKKQVEELQERLQTVEKLERSSSQGSGYDGYYNNIKEGHDSPTNLVKELKQENKALSLQLIEVKTNYAEAEQERSALQLKLKERNETLKKFSSEITKYEFEMVKAKQSLGEALNQNIELDQYNQELLEAIDKLKKAKKK